MVAVVIAIVVADELFAINRNNLQTHEGKQVQQQQQLKIILLLKELDWKLALCA